MKSFLIISLLALLLFVSPAAAQDSLSEGESAEQAFDRTGDDIDRFVNDIVGTIENRIDAFVDRRSSSSFSSTSVETEDQDKSSGDAITFNGNTEIAEHDTVRGDLVVKNGTLTVRGVVMGDVLVVNGDVEMKNTSRVYGNVRAMNGTISKDDGAFVEGYTEESNKNDNSRRKSTSRARYSTSFKPFTWYDREFDDNFHFRYNRVEGFFFGIGANKQYFWDGSRTLSGYGSFGYGFASHKWRLQLGLDRQFATASGLYEFGGEVHSLTDTKDEWIMKLSENNLAALLFHEDFRDYFQREGFSVHTARYTKEGDISTLIDLRYSVDRYTSMDQNAHWSLFGGRSFRSNPLVNHGMLRSVGVTAGFSSVEKYRRRSQGWDIFTHGEYAGRQAGGDFDFSQALVDVRRYQSLSDEDQISLRVRAGSLEGTPIVQRIFELGGANSMPAYGFKEFAGNRMVLANLEYQADGDMIEEIFFWPDFFSLIMFGDAGAVVNVPIKYGLHEGFDAIDASTFKSDLGFALGWHDGDARLGFAWRTDKKAPVAVFFRLNKAF